MSKPNETTWAIEPHTQAKHEILRRYLGAWFPILSKLHGRIIYIDGFSGPGEYLGGEPGSPIIALDVATNHIAQLDNDLLFQFVDERPDRIEHLDQLLSQKTIPNNFKIITTQGKFHEVLTLILERLDQEGKRIAPTFAFIDPFGFSGVPIELIHRLLAHKRTEAFITFQVSFINRFLKHPDNQVKAHFVELFGTSEVLKIAQSSGDRVTNLRNLYQEQLKQKASFVRYFQMKDRRNTPIYDLFFAGNHELGHCKMKEAMWRVDPEGDFIFSDATNPDQPVLFTLDHTPALLKEICEHFAGQKKIHVLQIKKWVMNYSPFLYTHTRRALLLGEKTDRFQVLEYKADSKKRRKGTFPDSVILNF